MDDNKLSGENKAWLIGVLIVCLVIFAISFLIYKSNSEVSVNIANIAKVCIEQGKNWVPSAVAGVFQCVGVSQQ